MLVEVPAGKYDWKPHDKSMIFGYLANMVATMPSWLAMGVTMNELEQRVIARAGEPVVRVALRQAMRLMAELTEPMPRTRSEMSQ